MVSRFYHQSSTDSFHRCGGSKAAVENIQYKYENEYIDQLGQSQNRATFLSVINMGNNFLVLFSIVFSNGYK